MPAVGTTPVAGEDRDASLRMHNYLLAQQRKKEDYWLRKYGKVRDASPPKSLPSLASRPMAGYMNLQPVVSLPAIHGHKGVPPMFQAKGPIRDFFSLNVNRPHAQNQQHELQLPHQTAGGHDSPSSPPQHTSTHYAGDHAMHSGSANRQYHKPPPIAEEPSDFGLQMESSLGSNPSSNKLSGLDSMRQLNPLQHQHQQHVHQHRGFASMALSGGNAFMNNPPRDLQMELAVLKSVKCREDVLDRLRIASEKLTASFGGGAPTVLPPADPLVRLFYRCISMLRQRTLDVVEAIAAWHRRVGNPEPFVYYGNDYLANIGPDLAFIDHLAFLRSRMTFTTAITDPFLIEVTSDGIVIEEASTCDLRRGGMRFTSDALRIRMARKVLAAYSGLPLTVSVLDVHESFPRAPLHGKGSHGASLAPLHGSKAAARQDLADELAADEADAALRQRPVSQLSGLGGLLPPLSAQEVKAYHLGEAGLDGLESSLDFPNDGLSEDDEDEDARELREEEEREKAAAEKYAAAAKQSLFGNSPRNVVADHKHHEGDSAHGHHGHHHHAHNVEVTKPGLVEWEESVLSREQAKLHHMTDEQFCDFALDLLLNSLEQPYLDDIPAGSFTIGGQDAARMIEASGDSELQAQADFWQEGEEQADEEFENNNPVYCDLVLDLVMQSLEEPFLSDVPTGTFTIGGLPDERVRFSDGSSIGQPKAAYHRSPNRSPTRSPTKMRGASALGTTDSATEGDQRMRASAPQHRPISRGIWEDDEEPHGFSSPGAPAIQGSLSARGNRSRVRSARKDSQNVGNMGKADVSMTGDQHHQDGLAIDDLVDDLMAGLDQF